MPNFVWPQSDILGPSENAARFRTIPAIGARPGILFTTNRLKEIHSHATQKITRTHHLVRALRLPGLRVTERHDVTTLRLAIVGAGPAGIYAADILLKMERSFDVSIDIFDHLPAPYGLVRYGVAPDHPRIKGIVTALREILDSDKIRLFGNVRFGVDLTLDDLRRHYNAVIFATGAVQNATLDIPGIALEGSFGAADFVSWFDGHPDYPRTWPLDARSVAVIGNGNVALDVARMLTKSIDDLRATEIPANVDDGLANSAVTDVHIFGRRGPANVKFTPLELRELGEVRDVDVVLNAEDFASAPHTATESNKQVSVINRVFAAWRERPMGAAARRLLFHFYARPVEIIASRGAVSAIRWERTAPDAAGGVRGTGEIRELAVQAVYRAVGYFGSPLPGVPFDERSGTIRNREGRVVEPAREPGDFERPLAGLYTTGWIKRGPVGLIGHTKSDAMETIRHLVSDRATWWNPPSASHASVVDLLEARGIEFTTLDGWTRLDGHEIAKGAAHCRERTKVVPREEMVEISRRRDRTRPEA